MAEFKLDGRMKVKTLKDNFKKNFGSTLRVYKSVTCKGAMADEMLHWHHSALRALRVVSSPWVVTSV